MKDLELGVSRSRRGLGSPGWHDVPTQNASPHLKLRTLSCWGTPLPKHTQIQFSRGSVWGDLPTLSFLIMPDPESDLGPDSELR